jgi:hypothetical protein
VARLLGAGQAARRDACTAQGLRAAPTPGERLSNATERPRAQSRRHRVLRPRHSRG